MKKFLTIVCLLIIHSTCYAAEGAFEKGSQSFKEYKPKDKTIGSRSVGKEALKKLKDML